MQVFIWGVNLLIGLTFTVVNWHLTAITFYLSGRDKKSYHLIWKDGCLVMWQVIGDGWLTTEVTTNSNQGITLALVRGEIFIYSRLKLFFEGFGHEAFFSNIRRSTPCPGEAPVMHRVKSLLRLEDTRSSPSIHHFPLRQRLGQWKGDWHIGVPP